MVHKKRPKKPVHTEEDDMEDMEDDIEDIDMNAVTDSEEEYTENERKLLDKVRNRRTVDNYDSADEVYGLQDSGEEEEEEEEQQDSMESDIEELQEDHDMPNDKAWGNKARTFYSSDFKYTDYASAPRKDQINADIEEEEGRKLHVRSLEQFLDTDDWDLSRIVETAEGGNDQREEQEQVSVQGTDEKFFMALVNSFKECMIEARDVLAPFLKLVEDGTCPSCKAADFIRIKYQVVLNYCINVSFCLMMKAKGLPVKSHPVIKRLAQYRQMLDLLQSRQGNVLEQAADIVKAVEEGKPLYNVTDACQVKLEKKAARLAGLSRKLTRQEEAAVRDQGESLSDVESMDEASMNEEASVDERAEDTEEKHDDEAMEDERSDGILDTNEEGKRGITYEIAKNRGLTPYRRKELRNPRVKHRNKYRKALIRRKGAVRQMRKELTRYSGEISGIKAGAKKGIKLK